MSRPSDTLLSRLSRLKQMNERCNRFEAAWRAGSPPRIEDYLDDPLVDSALLRHLIRLDVDYRRQVGDCPRAEDYRNRFPGVDAAWLDLAVSDSLGGSFGTLPSEPLSRLRATEFLDRLEAAQLIPAEEVDRLRDHLRASPEQSVDALIEDLLGEGRLAEYQVRALIAPIPIPLSLGPYVLDGWIAAGGMGSVFRATHRQMKRTVAVKVMHGGSTASAEQRRRFQREVEVAARLHHPNIVTAFDAGEQDGVIYLVTEFVDGEDLASLVKRAGPLPAARALDLVGQAAAGLHYAHVQGVIHRDVKPSNLMMGHDGVVRVLDVGLARPLAELDEGRLHSHDVSASAASELTAAGGLLGTVDFMAPEQAEDPRQADERSDIYSLGCTLWFLLTGRPPYASDTTYGRLLAHRESPVPSLRTARPELAAALDPLVQRMLAKQPGDRFASMRAVMDAVGARAPRGRLSRRVLLAVGGSAIAAGAVYFLGFREPTRPPLPAPPRVPFDAGAEQQRWARALGVPVEKSNRVGMRLVLVPPGSFRMGTPPAWIQQRLDRGLPPHATAFLRGEEQRETTIREPYYLGATEVTVGQFRRFVEATRHVTLAEKAAGDAEGGWGWHPQDGWRQKLGCSWKNADRLELTDDHPVGNTTWADAQAFCRWLTSETGDVCRLPTEAEWEFACRAGSSGLWCFGDDPALLPLYGWTEGVSGGVYHPVGRKRPNAFGLFDMHGNQHEWCALPDEPGPRDRPPTEELGPWAADLQPVRGGSFLTAADRTRSAARSWEPPNSFIPAFRVLQVVSIDR